MCGARCGGIALGSGDVGNWCEKCTACDVLLLEVVCDCVPGAAECIVVKVVVRERTEGAGDENVLSTPLPLLAPIVCAVCWPEDGACEGAASEWATSVLIVATIDLFPIVGGGCPSSEERIEVRRLLSDESLYVRPVGTGESGRSSLVTPSTRPDCGYGLLFFDVEVFLYCTRVPFFVVVEGVDSLADLKLVSFFIHEEKGRRRDWRSANVTVSTSILNRKSCFLPAHHQALYLHAIRARRTYLVAPVIE